MRLYCSCMYIYPNPTCGEVHLIQLDVVILKYIPLTSIQVLLRLSIPVVRWTKLVISLQYERDKS